MTEAVTLALDGSTYAGTVAVIRDGLVVAEGELPHSAIPGRSGRDENFMPMVAAALEEAGLLPRHIDRVVCGSGPGSFTSLRIAASIAKGLAAGAGKPLFDVPSLALSVAGSPAGRYLATLPAMRGEVFGMLADVDADGVITYDKAVIIAEAAMPDEAARHGAKLVSERPHARSAVHMLASILRGGPCDIETWEPAYGRLAEAQVKWEAAHGRQLSASE